MILFVPVFALFYSSKWLFKLFNQNEEVSRLAFQYIMIYWPGLLIFAMHDL